MKKLFFFAIAALLMLASCKDGILNHHEGIAGMQWKKGEKTTFTAEITDVSVPYDVTVALRHSSNIQYGDINIKMTRKGPGGETVEKEYTLPIRDPKTNQPYGEAMGDLCDTPVKVQEGTVFPAAGKYTYEIEHTMKEEVIQPVLEVGLIIAQGKK